MLTVVNFSDFSNFFTGGNGGKDGGDEIDHEKLLARIREKESERLQVWNSINIFNMIWWRLAILLSMLPFAVQYAIGILTPV